MQIETIENINTEPSSSPKGVKTETLEERGYRLPIGIRDDSGAYHRDVSFQRWNLKRNEELRRKQQEKGKGPVSMFRYVGIILSEMCKKIGPYDFESMGPKEKMLAVYQMYHGDVMFVYMALRREAMGTDLPMNLTCPQCGKKFRFTGDLDTLPVNSVEKVEDACWEYKLKEPIPIRDVTAESFQFQPVQWAAIEKLDPRDQAKIESKVILNSIKSVNGQEMILTDGELDEMSKRDFEEMLYLAGENSIGPDMSIDSVCDDPRCEYEWRTALDWTYDNFFSVTSR